VPPACYPKLDDTERFAMTLSLWDDLESVAAFAYNGAHAEALMRRKDWFQSLGLPSYVAWWVAEDHNLDWKEGSDRLDHLHAHGSSAFAFNFAKPFDASVIRAALIAQRWKPRRDRMRPCRNKPLS